MAEENRESGEEQEQKPYILIRFVDSDSMIIQRVEQSPNVTAGQMGQAAFRLNVLATATIINNIVRQNMQIAQPSPEQVHSILEQLKPQ